MKKFAVFSTTIFISIILAGLYGILHDQVTYTISPEYFSKFKFNQFGVNPTDLGGHRQAVALIGFLATWWTGIFIGLGLGLTGLLFKDHKTMNRAIRKAIFIIFCIVMVMGLIGFLFGKLKLVNTGGNWSLPDNLNDKNSFITVGSIHNFSYLGGLLGLIIGIFYLVLMKKAQTKTNR